MKELTEKVKESLDFDPLAEAERIAGGSYKEDDAIGFLGLAIAMKSNEEKNGLLMLSGDTHFGTTIPELNRMLETMGFKLLTDEPTLDGNHLRIWWNETDGMLVVVESYYGDKSINSFNCYLNYQGPRDAIHHCSNGPAGKENDTWDVHVDGREGFKFTIETMRQSGRFLPQWVESPFMWLLSCSDTRNKDYDYKAINASRLSKLPLGVQEAILFPLED